MSLSTKNIVTTKRQRTTVTPTVLGDADRAKSPGLQLPRRVRALSDDNDMGRRGAPSTSSSSSPAFSSSSSSSSSSSNNNNSALQMDPLVQPFVAWKRNIPLLYDAVVYHSLAWSSLACAFARDAGVLDEFDCKRTVYYSSRTKASYDRGANRWSAGGQPSYVYVATVDAPQVNTSRRRYMARFADTNKSSRVNGVKKMTHPGEVSRICVSPTLPNVIATHTDSTTVYVWDVKRQQDRTPRPLDPNSGNTALQVDASGAVSKQRDCNANEPDLRLEGHSRKAEFALDMSPNSSHVLSGGSDALVCRWDLGDWQAGGSKGSAVAAATVFKGHAKAVEACAFHPTDAGTTMASVGRDAKALFWDARAAATPTRTLSGVHEQDINCCAWSPKDEHLFATGSSDAHIAVHDLRREAEPLHRVHAGVGSVLNLRWSPHHRGFLAASGEQSHMKIWRMTGSAENGVGAGAATNGDNGSGDGELKPFFVHVGHKTPITDFDWCAADPWALLSTSADVPTEQAIGGGCMQFWRVSEFITRADDDDFVDSTLEGMLAASQKGAKYKL